MFEGSFFKVLFLFIVTCGTPLIYYIAIEENRRKNIQSLTQYIIFQRQDKGVIKIEKESNDENLSNGGNNEGVDFGMVGGTHESVNCSNNGQIGGVDGSEEGGEDVSVDLPGFVGNNSEGGGLDGNEEGGENNREDGGVDSGEDGGVDGGLDLPGFMRNHDCKECCEFGSEDDGVDVSEEGGNFDDKDGSEVVLCLDSLDMI